MLGEPIKKQIIEEVVNRTISLAKNSGDPLEKSSTHYALGDLATRSTFASITSVPNELTDGKSIRIASFLKQEESFRPPEYLPGVNLNYIPIDDPTNNFKANFWSDSSGRGYIPPPGISEITTKYLGTGALLGTTKEATVTLHVHSNQQYNLIVPSFVRIQKPVMIQFGFTNPQIEIERANYEAANGWYRDARSDEQVLEGAPPAYFLDRDKCSKFTDAMSLHTRGNVETLFGAVVNYDISLNSLGGYDITLIIRTQGHAFYNQDFNTDNSARIGPFLGVEGAANASISYIAGRATDRRDPLIMLAKYREVIQEDFNIIDVFKAPTEADGNISNAMGPILKSLESSKNYFFSTECPSTYAYPDEQKGGLAELATKLGTAGFTYATGDTDTMSHLVAMHHSRDMILTVTDYAKDGKSVWAEFTATIPYIDKKITSPFVSSIEMMRLCPINYYVTMGYVEDMILSRLFGTTDVDSGKLINGIRSIFLRAVGDTEHVRDSNKMLVHDFMVPKDLNEILVNTPATLALLNDANNGTVVFETGVLEDFFARFGGEQLAADIERNELRSFMRSIGEILQHGVPFLAGKYKKTAGGNLETEELSRLQQGTATLNEENLSKIAKDMTDATNLSVANYRAMYVNLDVVIKAFVGEGNDDFIHKNYFPSNTDYAPKGDKNQFNLWELIEEGIILEPDHFVETFKQGMGNLLEKVSDNFYNYPELHLDTNTFYPNHCQVYDGRYARSDMPIFQFDSYSRNSLVTSVDLKSSVPNYAQLAASLGASGNSNLPIESYNSEYNSSISYDLMQNVQNGENVGSVVNPKSVHTIQMGRPNYLDKYKDNQPPLLILKDPKVEKQLIEDVNEVIDTPDETILNTNIRENNIADMQKIQNLNTIIDRGTAGLGGNDGMGASSNNYLYQQSMNFILDDAEQRADPLLMPYNDEYLRKMGVGGSMPITTEDGTNLDITYPPPTLIPGAPLRAGDEPDKVDPQTGVVLQQDLADEIQDAEEELAVLEGDEPTGMGKGGVDPSQLEVIKDIQEDIIFSRPNITADGSVEKSVFLTGIATSVIDLKRGGTEDKEDVYRRKGYQSLRELIGTLGKYKTIKDGKYSEKISEERYMVDSASLIEAIQAYVTMNQNVSNSSRQLHQFIRDTQFQTLDVKTSDHGPLHRNNVRISVGDDWISYVEFLIYQADRQAMASLTGQAYYYELSFEMDGIGGILPGQAFTLSYLPDYIAKNFYFIVKNVNQTMTSDGWKTQIEGLQRRLEDTRGISNVADYIADHSKPAIPPAKKKSTNSAQPLPEPPRPNIPVPSDDEDILPDIIFEVEPLTDADFLDPIFFVPPPPPPLRRAENDLEEPGYVYQDSRLDEGPDIRRAEPPDLLADLYDTPRVPEGTGPPPPSPNPFIPYELADSDTAELLLTMTGKNPNIAGLEGGPQKTLILYENGRPDSDPNKTGNMKTSFGVTDILSANEYRKIKETFISAYNLNPQTIDDYMAEIYEERKIIDQYKKSNEVDKALERTGNKTEPQGNPKYDKGPGVSVLVYIRKDSEINSLLKDLEELQKTYIGNDPSNVSGNDNNYIDDIIVKVLSEPDRTLLTTIPMGKPEPEIPTPPEDIADADTYYDEFQQETEQDQEEPMESDPATIMRGRTLDSYNTPSPEPDLADALDNDTQDAPPAPPEPVVEPVLEYKVTLSREQFLSGARAVIGYAGVVVYDPRAHMVAVRDGVEVASSDEPKTDPILNDPAKARQELEKQGKWNGGVYNLLLQRNPNASANHSDVVDFDYMNGLLKKALTTEQDARIYTQAFLRTCELGNQRFSLNFTPDNYRGSGERPIRLQDYNDIAIYNVMVDDANKVTANDGTTFKSSQGDITEVPRAKYYCHANNQFATKFKKCIEKFPNLNTIT